MRTINQDSLPRPIQINRFFVAVSDDEVAFYILNKNGLQKLDNKDYHIRPFLMPEPPVATCGLNKRTARLPEGRLG